MSIQKPFAATLAAATLGLSAMGASALTIDVASTFPTDMIFLGDGLKKFKDEVAAVSGGDIEIKIHGAGELVPALEVLNAVSSGAVAGGYDWVGYWGGQLPVANLLGSLPFGPSPEILGEWIWEGGGMEIAQKAYDARGVQFLPCVSVPAEPAGWFNKEINTVEDLQGLRMRIGGLAGRALQEVGVSTQLIPGGEVFVSLERGRIDAAEFSLPVVDESVQLNAAAKYYYFPGWHQPSSINSILIGKGVWDGLDETQKSQVLAACRSTYLWTLTSGLPDQAEALERMKEGGTTVLRLPDPVLDALRVAVETVVTQEREGDELFNEAYESLTSYMENRATWADLQRID